MALSQPSPFLHPVLMLAVQSVVSATALDARSFSRNRWISLVTIPAQLGCVGAIVYKARSFVRPSYAAWIASFSITTCLRCLGLCFIRQDPRPEKESRKQVESPGASRPKPSTAQSLWRSFVHMFDCRHLNSADEAKGSPHFSSQDLKWTPSRARFLVTTALKGIANYLIIDLLSGSPLPPNAAADFAPDRMHFFTRLSSVTINEVIQRYIIAVSVFVVGASMLEVCHSACAFVAVASGWSGPRDWRPQFGSLAAAYTLRRWWGEVWHQNLRIMFTIWSDNFSDLIFGSSSPVDRTHRLLKRYARLVLVFGISGLVHWLAEIASGVPPSKARDYVFFLYQAFGIMIEDAGEAWFEPSDKPQWSTEREILRRSLGYVWVLSFFAWSVPWWIYPSTHHAVLVQRQPQSLVLFSVLRWKFT